MIINRKNQQIWATYLAAIHQVLGLDVPNHGCELEDIPFPLPAKGTGICPVSHCPLEFQAEVDEEKVVIDKFGNPQKTVGWSLSGFDYEFPPDCFDPKD